MGGPPFARWQPELYLREKQMRQCLLPVAMLNELALAANAADATTTNKQV